MSETTPAASAADRGTRRPRALAVLIAAGVLLSPLLAPLPAIAAVSTVEYAVVNAGFGSPLTTGWSATGDAEIERSLVLTTGGVAYQPITLSGGASAPAVGDVVTAEVDVTVRADVTAASTVVVRLTDGSSILSEWTDLSSLARGERLTLTSQTVSNGAAIGTGAGALWIELHNDSAGVIEFHDVRISGIRSGVTVEYAVPNADFSAPLNASSNWSSGSASIVTSLVLGAGASVSQTLPVGAQTDLPQAGDEVALTVDAFVDGRAPGTSAVIAKVQQGSAVLLDAVDAATVQRGLWHELVAGAGADGNVVGATGDLELTLTNPTDYPVRLKDVRLSAQRSEGSDDLNGDGSVDALDADWFRDEVAGGTTDLALDYDDDGQVTLKDVSYFVRFILRDESEVYANLRHLDFLSEHVELDGIPMMIVHLYAEPTDRSDLSKGYEWVGDPQEGVSALDDVARAVIVYAEHYASYRDQHSYDQMVRGLEFAMWMQAPNGDFDNFVARDSNGDLVKKDSASSQTAFSFWAARAYEAIATARPLIAEEDAAFAARLDNRLALCLDRIEELVGDEYGVHQASGAPAWLLLDDNWLSSAAVTALVKHAAILSGGNRDRAMTQVERLAEGIAYYQGGDFDSYPLGAVVHNNGRWYEWGSIQAKALALAGDLTGHEEWVDAARLVADSFLSDLLISGRSFEIAPNKSGLPQINYGTASYVENLLALYSVTGERKYADLAGIAAAWWTGDNPLGVPMFDQELGLAFDGITTGGLNNNSGAESVDEALRAILRLQRVPEAMALMTAERVDERTAQTVEFETLYAGGSPADEQLALPDGGLNDVAFAHVTQVPSSGSDESAIYGDAAGLVTEQDVYAGWRGAHALFVTGSGYNNVRLFDEGYIYLDVPIGGAGQAQVGDALMLDFSALLQFSTNLDAEVLAVDAGGAETVLADDADFVYNARTWYSGSASVRTTVRAVVPDDTDHVTVRFSAQSSNANPPEGYATVTLASLIRLGAPEVRYGSSALSNRAYAAVGADRTDSFAVDVAAPGDHALFLSSVGSPAVTLESPGAFDLTADVEGTGIAIHGLGRADLSAGPSELTVETGRDGANLDALILYPVQTWATYRGLDGAERTVMRDLGAGTLVSGDPDGLEMGGVAAWAPTQVYLAGDEVIYDGSVWVAQWWAQNQNPGAVYGAWSEVGEFVDGEHRAWTPSWVYTGGQVVGHDGQLWKARWWTRNQEPGTGSWGPWELVG